MIQTAWESSWFNPHVEKFSTLISPAASLSLEWKYYKNDWNASMWVEMCLYYLD